MNHKFFVLFVGYTMCTCIIALVLIFIRALHCGWVTDDEDPAGSSSGTINAGGMDNNDLHADSSALSTVNSTAAEDQNHRFLETIYKQECQGFYNSYATLILLIVSVIFMIFTCCMLFEQIEAISTNASKIARMKMRVGQAGTELARVTEEFNEMFGGNSNDVAWHWFLPIEVEFPRGMKKVVLGYEWDETFDAVPYEEPSGTHGSLNGSSVGGQDEEEGAVELTSTHLISSASSSGPISASLPGNGQSMSAPPSLNHVSTDDGGEEAAFAGTPVITSEGRPRLKQRSNSREARLKPAPGTLT